MFVCSMFRADLILCCCCCCCSIQYTNSAWLCHHQHQLGLQLLNPLNQKKKKTMIISIWIYEWMCFFYRFVCWFALQIGKFTISRTIRWSQLVNLRLGDCSRVSSNTWTHTHTHMCFISFHVLNSNANFNCNHEFLIFCCSTIYWI